jgi:hypothetical protein
VRLRQQGGNAADHVANRERLGQVGIDAEFHAGLLVRFPPLGSQHDDPQPAVVRVRPQHSADVVAVASGHHDIKEDKLGRRLGDRGQGRITVGHGAHLMPFFPHEESQSPQDIRVVVGDQNRRHDRFPINCRRFAGDPLLV